MINKKAKGGVLIGVILVIFFAIIYISFIEKPIIQTNYLNSTLPILTNNLSIICVSGYSSTVRDVPQSLREEVFARDNVSYPQPTGTTELDHKISLALGGSNDENNLWVQFAPAYKEKDKLEDYLYHHVCSGEININYAQQRIYDNWSLYYQEIYG